jgi:hypothetical protein
MLPMFLASRAASSSGSTDICNALRRQSLPRSTCSDLPRKCTTANTYICAHATQVTGFTLASCKLEISVRHVLFAVFLTQQRLLCTPVLR